MEKYLALLVNLDLFRGFSGVEITMMAHCLNVRVQDYAKNEIVLDKYRYKSAIGIVLRGVLHNVIVDLDGNQTIITAICEGGMFGEALVCAEVSNPNITIEAVQNSQVMYLDYNRILAVCSNTCDFHLRLIKNMLKVLADKNIMLTEKLQHITKRTTREKLMSYLSSLASKSGCRIIDLPFNREELADYLSVDRSAMCAELSRMKKEGLIDYYKNKFELKLLR